MKQTVLHTAALLLSGAAILLGRAPVQAQARKASVRPYVAAQVMSDTAVRRGASPRTIKPLLQPARSVAARNGVCDLMANGDFELQTTPNGPTRRNNLGGGYAGGTGTSGPIATELAGWIAPTECTPEYFATNADPSSPLSWDVNPATTSFGTFTPANGRGAVGMGTYEDGARRVSEYVQTDLGAGVLDPNGVGMYYASFRVQLSSSLAVNNREIAEGFGLQVSAAPLAYASGSHPYNDDFLERRPADKGVLTTTPLTSANASAWTTVSGQIHAEPGDRYMTIGLFNPDLSARGNDVTTGSPATGTARTYCFVDDVQLFKIPTAGPRRQCNGYNNQTVQIGEGCEIPGATYEWRKGSMTAPVFSTSLINFVYPTTSSFYYLNVTLPDGSGLLTTTIVYVCPDPPKCPPLSPPSIDRAWWGCPQGAGPVAVIISNYVKGNTYTISTTGDITSPGTLSYPYVPAPPQPNVPGAAAFYVSSNVSSGKGYVTVTVTDACGQTASSTILLIAPDYANPCPKPRTAYPNPAESELMVTDGAADAVLLNNQGKVVGRADATGKVDVKGLPPGLYNLQTRQNGKLVNQHIEVRH